MKIARAIAVLGTMLLLVACSDDSNPEVTGVFVDAEVAGLGYECGDDTTRRFTNAAGEFTCPAGSEVRFYIGEILLGSVTATLDLEVVTPSMLTGADVDDLAAVGYGGSMPSPELFSSVNMAALLQSFDEDGDPDNGIVITDEIHDAFPVPGEWDYDEEESPVVEELFDALEELEIEPVDEEEAFEHLLEQTEKLLYGMYEGTVVDEEETIEIDLFLFYNAGGGNADPGMQARLLLSNLDESEPVQIELGVPYVSMDDVYLAMDLSLNGIVVRVYDAVAMAEAEFEPPVTEDGQADLAAASPYLMHTVNLVKTVDTPDVTILDIGTFLAQLPEGSEVPEDLDEISGPRVGIFAAIPEEESPAPIAGFSQGGELWIYGQAQKTGFGGGFLDLYVDGGHLVVESLSESTLVYVGRAFMTRYEIIEEQWVDTTLWGDARIQINVDGSVQFDVTADDGVSFSESLEVMEAGVGQPF